MSTSIQPPNKTTGHCQSGREMVDAVVTGIKGDKVTVSIEAPKQKSCSQCQSQGGCQSLSLYQLIYAKRPLTINNRDYRLGEQLQISFPNTLIRLSIYWLLGMPLLGFIVGVIIGWQDRELIGFFVGIGLAFLGFLWGKRQMQKKVHQSLIITSKNKQGK
ncbi:MAG: hypothetical protein CSA45_04465 [Gammaproteobacteria bacterium]|nr:MAG: hypothetical protein CSA45_04465 [Gammaproteobacteria bacterium]